MKKISSILIFFLLSHIIYGQCGTTQYTISSGANTGFPDGPRYVNLNIHIVKYDDCSGGASLAQVGEVVDQLNESFNPSQIYFNIACILDFCKTECYENNCLIDNYFNINSVPNSLNLYLALATSGGSGGPCGVSGRAESPLQSKNCWAQIVSGSVLIPVHEIGHCLGLNHTFVGGDECVPRDPSHPHYNCPTKGDGLCDTPADIQNYGALVASNCTWDKNLAEQMNIRDVCGNVLETDPSLAMSYSPCGTRFSPQQGLIMRNNIMNGSSGPQAPAAQYGNFYISKPTVWYTPKRFSVDVIVANSLTIQGTSVHMAPGKKIVIQNGKNITVANSLITVGNLSNCGNSGNGVMWKGIEIHASTIANVVINGGSRIDKAENGLYLATANDNKVWITVSGSSFTDNLRAMSLISNTIAPRALWVNNTTFELTSSYPINYYSRQLYLGNFPLFNAQGIHFKNNKDINAAEAGGLYSYNGGVRIGSGTQEGFVKGIEGIGFGLRNALTLNLFNSKKSINHVDIKSRRSNSVTRCTIDEGDRTNMSITTGSNFGLRIDDCQGNSISSNTFEDKKIVPGNWTGMIVNNVGSEYQKIGIANNFKNLLTGATTNSKNQQVEFLCNFNFTNTRDFDWSQVNPTQGLPGLPAGNTFSPSNNSITAKNIRTNQTLDYHYGIGTGEFPMSVSPSVNRIMSPVAGCLHSTATPSDDVTQLDGDYINLKYQLDGLLPLVSGNNGGNSNNQAINAQIHILNMQIHEITNHAIELLTNPESGSIDYPTLIIWLQRINTFESISNIAYIHFLNGNYVQAQAVHSNLTSQFVLNNDQLQEWNNMSWLMNFMNIVYQSGRWEGALTTNEVVSLQNFASSNTTASCQMAANILEFFYNIQPNSNQNAPSMQQGSIDPKAEQHNILTERSLEGISIYPTPMHNSVNIEFGKLDASKDYNYVINDLNGKSVFKGKISHFITKIDIREIPEGVYFIKILDHQSLIHTQKLIKK